MKRLLFTAMLAIAISAAAQTPTVTTPQSVTNATVFNGVSTAQASACLSNEGQNVHFVFYSAGGATGNPTGVQIRLEASYNSDAATCSTGTWFSISDDGTDPGQNGTGLVLGIGTFPFVRANLVKCTGCDANDTISASYTGTSSIPGNPFGLYGAGQQIRKVTIFKQTTGTITSSKFLTPYGSTAGFLVVNGSAAFTAGSITARCQDFASTNITQLTLPSATLLALPVAAAPCVQVDVRCQACANSAGTMSAYWFFYPPGAALPAGAQPANATNSEATAAVNTAVVTTLTVQALQRGHLFLVNARCSAGTAQLTVTDGAAQIFSSSPAEVVAATSYTKSWPVGLTSSPGNNLVVTLGTCGVGNTGTLDVQGSVF